MVLTKDELIKSLQSEVRILLHLASKVDAAKLDYRPTPKQRSMLELLQYMTIIGPIHLRGVLAGVFDMDAWRSAWTTGEAAAKARNLEEVKDAIGKQSALFAELLGSCSDADLRAEIQMFGHKASRGSIDRQPGAVPLCCLSQAVVPAVVPVSEGQRPRGTKHHESVGRNGRVMKKPKSSDRGSATKSSLAPKDVDEYLAKVPEPARSTLNRVRAAIRAAVPPGATETISYRMPAFKYKGLLVWFAAFSNHCSLFPGSSVIEAFKNELKDFPTSKGTIRFPVDKPLSAALVKKLVKARVAENERKKQR